MLFGPRKTGTGRHKRSWGAKLPRVRGVPTERPPLPFSLWLLGPRFRGASNSSSVLENGEPCYLHNLCDACRAVMKKSLIVRGSRLWLVPSLEYFTLHETVGHFEAAFRAKCHLCSLLWSQTCEEFGSDPNLEFKNCPVFLRISIDHDMGPKSLSLIAIVSPDPRAKVWCMDWDDWTYGKIPVARLSLSPTFIHLLQNMKEIDLEHPPDTSHGETNTSSAAHMSLTKFWLSECLTYHSHCQLPETSFTPKRLIAIDYPSIRLHLTQSEGLSPQYCALSHCWGGAADIPVLNTENLESRLAGISVDDLPKSFKDAIRITHSIGLRYLWIDCLCIIQDSVDDWTTESAVMGRIYEGACCTILAAAAATAHEGCFWQRNPLSYSPCRVAGNAEDGLFACDARTTLNQSFDKPLYRRAWTFQERLLSARVIEFHRFGVEWRCRLGTASEFQPYGEGFLVKDAETNRSTIFGPDARHKPLSIYQNGEFRAFARLLGGRVSPPDLVNDATDAFNFHSDWFHIVRKYSNCELTRPSDKLVALSGIVQRIKMANPDLQYGAGLWTNPASHLNTFELDLLWWVSFPRPQSDVYLAPTWSWASQTGPVRSKALFKTGYTSMIKIREIFLGTSPLDNTHTGAVHGGKLVLTGIVRSLGTLKFTFSPGLNNYLGMTITEGDKKIGYFVPDFSSPCSVSHLLPIRQTHKVTGLSALGWSNGAPPADFTGLVLSCRGGVYFRVGLFVLMWDDIDTTASGWFDDCQEQEVVIY